MADARWRTVANKVVPDSLHGQVRTTYHRLRTFVPRPRAPASWAKLGLGRSSDLGAWLAGGCEVPASDIRKRQTLYELLMTSPVEVVVETGTLLGDTTAFLAAHARQVVTIE